ncbi:glycosyltransferase family 9 protein [Psychrobium sp. 1_MG-2023]|uniref:glycosyltransferase family 9 protein n=1 Tax=Psychrobium sp. 1_MG-2023 TaxID=3062624 RepID=UPI000C321348|nr:glycosyltransferase family 9 protein [Psychrobium sp. 1_MG-2023]MDP2562532.1 glycosyltransferase family 9 protein [Psychrobium sp. 1_MG-2023]PKF57976.1 ADP-heptose--LPS heptosyltransferase I [Alteromonadales bacterium alter-6D02]
MSYPGDQPQSICILRLSAIGDVCNSVAAVQAIQRRWPEAQITWVIGKVEAMLLEGLPGVEFVIFDKTAGLQGYKDLRKAFKGRKFDVLLQMQVALRASLASWCIKAKFKVGFDKKRAKEGQWLFVNRRIRGQKAPHVLDGFMEFAHTAGVTDLEPRWEMPLPQSDEQWGIDHINPKKRTLIICAAASKAERNWNSEGYAAINDHAQARGWQVILCGGPTDFEIELAQEIEQLAKARPENLVGKSSLKQLLGLLKHADLVIAPDTGPAHMAVTVDTPVIGLYAHSNPGRTGPYSWQQYVVSVYEQHIISQQQRPINLVKWGVRAKGDKLMNDITFKMVKDKFETVILDRGLTKITDQRFEHPLL